MVQCKWVRERKGFLRGQVVGWQWQSLWHAREREKVLGGSGTCHGWEREKRGRVIYQCVGWLTSRWMNGTDDQKTKACVTVFVKHQPHNAAATAAAIHYCYQLGVCSCVLPLLTFTSSLPFPLLFSNFFFVFFSDLLLYPCVFSTSNLLFYTMTICNWKILCYIYFYNQLKVTWCFTFLYHDNLQLKNSMLHLFSQSIETEMVWWVENYKWLILVTMIFNYL